MNYYNLIIIHFYIKYNFGEKFYPELLKELKKAEKFIFMEYFIINEGKMWNGILDILKEKAEQGVDVRILYDDFDSTFKNCQKLEDRDVKAGFIKSLWQAILRLFAPLF